MFEFHYDSIISKYGKHIGGLTTGCSSVIDPVTLITNAVDHMLKNVCTLPQYG